MSGCCPTAGPMEIIVETAGESTEEVDVLELIADSWRKIGVKLFTKPSQLEVLRNRIYAGQTMMAIAKGVDNGIPTADMAPTEFVPIDQNQYQWPKWGQFYQTGGTAGEEPDMPQPKELMDLMTEWRTAKDTAGPRRCLAPHPRHPCRQVFTIGLINGTLQPVVVRSTPAQRAGRGHLQLGPRSAFRHLPARYVLVRPKRAELLRFRKGRTVTMLGFFVRRIMVMIPTLLAISAITFVIIQLPPGDYLTTLMTELESRGEAIDQSRLQFLRETYGLDKPMIEQYFVWLGGMLTGDYGYSFEYNRPVADVVGDRMLLTIVVSFATIIFIWVVSFPIGIYSATHQYSLGDYGLTFLGFLGLGDAQFPAGAGAALFRQRDVRHLHRRA